MTDTTNSEERKTYDLLKPPHHLALWLGALGALSSIAFFALAFFNIKGKPVLLTVMVIWLLVAFTAILALLVFQEIRHDSTLSEQASEYCNQLENQAARYERSSRYAEAMIEIHKAFHDLRDTAYFRSRGGSQAQEIDKLSESLSSFASGFSVITGSSVRACIKELQVDSTDENVPKEARQDSERKRWPGYVGQLFVLLKWYPAHHYAAASSLRSVSQ